MKRPRRKVCFTPTFRVQLIQMLRHGEIDDAMKRALTELTHSLAALKKAESDGGPEGRVLTVPTAEREREYQRTAARAAYQRPRRAQELDHGRD
jgi:hypothetical protein